MRTTTTGCMPIRWAPLLVVAGVLLAGCNQRAFDRGEAIEPPLQANLISLRMIDDRNATVLLSFFNDGPTALRNFRVNIQMSAVDPETMQPRRGLQNHFYHTTAPPGAEWARDRVFNQSDVIEPGAWWNVSLRHEYWPADVVPGDYHWLTLSFSHYDDATHRWHYMQDFACRTAIGEIINDRESCRGGQFLFPRRSLETGKPDPPHQDAFGGQRYERGG